MSQSRFFTRHSQNISQKLETTRSVFRRLPNSAERILKSLRPSVRPSLCLRLKQLGNCWTDSYEHWNRFFFLEFSTHSNSALNLPKITGPLYEDIRVHASARVSLYLLAQSQQKLWSGIKPIFHVQYILSIRLTVWQIVKLKSSIISGGKEREKAPEHCSAMVVLNLCPASLVEWAATSRRQKWLYKTCISIKFLNRYLL
jgi:hypothetical protein